LIQLIRYGVVAVVAACVDTGVLWMLSRLFGVHYTIAAVVGFTAGLVCNFLLARRFVFEKASMSVTGEFLGYAIIGVVGVGLTEVILYLGIGVAGLGLLPAKAIALVIVFFWNYLARRVIIYRSPACP